MQKVLSILCLYLFWVGGLNAQPDPTIKTIARCSEDSIRTWMSRYHVPSVGIGIIEDGRISSIKVYGGPVNAMWNVASMTKPVMAVTVLKLIQAGKWDLDESLSHYYIDPDIKDEPWTDKLTTRIMLAHQSGFLNWKRMEPDNKLHFHFEPGKGWKYSGNGYEYLRMAVEAKFHKSLQQLAEQEIFQPLHMQDTHFGWRDDKDSARFSWGYDTSGKRNNGKYIGNNAADWLVTTVADYSAFSVHVMQGAGIDPSLFQQMTSVQTPFDSSAVHVNGMGLGWHVIKGLPDNEYVITHDGSDEGVATIGFLLPVSKRGIIIFTNGDEGAKVFSRILQQSLPDMRAALSHYMREFR